ncbi:hypothetical protein [Azoarcus sp. KH32C]|uniref:hypothetical protein n=1 Tax=Azoarcus sp. KH32C TaxID=748247 RepID=UPI00023866E2|nr:hypothetical protein [Azoarcus sp. KH32C]BAL23676.1 hypothetical protein AZKH_1354 [Azoarcus sp. KH32C]
MNTRDLHGQGYYAGGVTAADEKAKQADLDITELLASASPLAIKGLCFSPVQHGVRVSGDGCYLAALANILDRAMLGTFRQTFERNTRKTVHLEIPHPTMRLAKALLMRTTTDDLDAAAAEVVLRERKAREEETARARYEGEIQLLTPRGMAERLVAASMGRLLISSVIGGLTLKVSELLPVTHFKALARLTRYEAKTRLFRASCNDLNDLGWRLKLLALAERIGKSTKKVTVADIAARRERVRAKVRPLDMDFSEACEDFGEERARKWLQEGRLTETLAQVRAYEE